MRVKLFVFTILSLFIFSACEKEEAKSPITENELPPGTRIAQVLEVQDVSAYTYLRVKENENEYWMAITKAEFKVGEWVYFMNAMEMTNFKSEDLNKTFDKLLFVENAKSQQEVTEALQKTAEPQKPTITKTDVSVEKAEGGITIGELFANAANYSGKSVKIRAKVIKVNLGIMDRNWFHIQDGTSSGEDFDLTVTSADTVNEGDIITFQGKVAVDKDFGYGYSYKMILEEAKVLSRKM
ncbi:MAG: hypothetical protein AMXMBFR51_29370 [Ignavibacteriota bacterium]